MKILSLNFFFAIIIFSLNGSATNLNKLELKAFISDGCTFAPDGTFKNPELWRECCVEHDLWFWGGGTKEQRLMADSNLKVCIKNKSNQFTADIFMWGVSLGGLSPIKLQDKKWGNGWLNNPIDYRVLSHEEISLLIEYLDQLNLNSSIIATYRSYLLSL